MMSAFKCDIFLSDLLIPVGVPAKHLRGMMSLDPTDPIQSSSSAFQELTLKEPLLPLFQFSVQRFEMTSNGWAPKELTDKTGIYHLKCSFILLMVLQRAKSLP